MPGDIILERFARSQFKEPSIAPSGAPLVKALSGVKGQLWAMDVQIFVSGSPYEKKISGFHDHDVSLIVPKAQKEHISHLLETFSIKPEKKREHPENQNKFEIYLGKVSLTAEQIMDLSKK